MNWVFPLASLLFFGLMKNLGRFSVSHGVLIMGLALQIFINSDGQLAQLALVGRTMLILAFLMEFVPKSLSQKTSEVFKEKRLGIKFALFFLFIPLTIAREQSMIWAEASLLTFQGLFYLVFFNRFDLWQKFLQSALLFSMVFSYFLFAGKIFPASQFMLPTLWMVSFSVALLALNSTIKGKGQTLVKGS